MITSGSERRIDRSAAPNERSAFGIDLHLVDPREPVLDRILDRDDVDLRVVDLGDRRVERGRLSRSRWAGDEKRPGRLSHNRGDGVAHRLRQPERLERRRLARLVDQAHHDLLAFDRRQHGNADVEHPADRTRVERDPAVLRAPALGDIELGEHLEPRGHTRGHPLGDALRLGEHAVDAGAHEERVLLRLEMDVAGAVAGGLHDDRVDQPDERSVGDPVVGLEIVLVALLAELDIDRRLGLDHLALALEALELGGDLLAATDGEIDRVAGGDLQLVEAEDVARIGDRDKQPIVLGAQRERRRRAEASAAG